MSVISGYLKEGENILAFSRRSKAAIAVTWLSIPSVFLFYYLVTLPAMIKRLVSSAFRKEVADSLGITEIELGFSELLSAARIDITVFIPDFVITLIKFSAILLVIAWLLWAAFTTFQQMRNALIRTENRILAYSKKQVLVAPISEIKNISVEQSLWGKLFCYGNISILCQKGAITVKNISDPQGWKHTLMLLVNE